LGEFLTCNDANFTSHIVRIHQLHRRELKDSILFTCYNRRKLPLSIYGRVCSLMIEL